MRSPTGPILVILGLATVLGLVIGLFTIQGLRTDLETARAEINELRTEVTARDDGVSLDELETALTDLEGRLAGSLGSGSGGTGGDGDPAQPAGGGDDVEDRLDEILARITALDERVDDICGNVPVC